ncbi:MAG: DUF5721 family protein [Defluviitaleaceae bacterium]|nr:DUF5721 family protein [Defluviitaleaceae bacterium]
MLALELDKACVKGFMAKLLREDLFDEFELRSVEIFAAVKVTVDGANETDCSAWSAVRPLACEIVKMCAKPRRMKVIFSRKNASVIHINAAAVFLNIFYENDGVTFTTATSQKEFAVEKSLDSAWDSWVREFFSKAGIEVKDRSI